MLTENEARNLLASYVPLDQTWGAHSLAVSRAAGIMADALLTAGAMIDPILARTGGLLHDIGRSATHDFSGHAWAGSEILLAMDQPILARFCTAHQCAGMTAEEAQQIDWPAVDYRPHTWEEKAVTLADGMAAGGRIVLLADRCTDVLARYSDTLDPIRLELLLGVEPKMRALMAEVEATIGQSVETICGAKPL